MKEKQESLDWKEIKLETCDGGMSRMDFNKPVIAVLVYMKDHYLTTPDEYNFQAEFLRPRVIGIDIQRAIKILATRKKLVAR